MAANSSWNDGFIAVDWGTTNRRAYLVGKDMACAEEYEDGQGILTVGAEGFEAAVAQIRDRLGDKPMLLAGMVGSNRGWIEAPYVPCPAGIAQLAGKLAWIADRSAAIVPGVSFSNGHCDVMRGEEVQLVGAVARSDIPPDCIVCHPGTHNKWVRMTDGRIDAFQTVMTGELFSLLKARSILSDLLGGTVEASGAFRDGVKRGLSGSGVTAELFGARARALLGKMSSSDGASFVSGLLIGEDVRVGLESFSGHPVYLMGRRDLTGLYSVALGEAGVETIETNGVAAFLAGASKIAETIE